MQGFLEIIFKIERKKEKKKEGKRKNTFPFSLILLNSWKSSFDLREILKIDRM